jgi:Tol biopolymer transport system component/predicted Ser/Thr protein kinase
MPLAPATRLGPYEILAPLGAGGMGEVYQARDTRLDRLVAIKVSKEQFSERFAREAQSIAPLNHPHICTLHDVGPNYLVMEYIDGAPLKGPMPLELALKYAGQICDALDAAHKKGITHRDLKPANILVTKAGVKLLDFGLARIAASPDETMTMAVMGTPAYMAPEQWEGKPGDARSDIYSLGCVLYEILTGKRASSERVAVEPAALEQVLRTCLEKDPDARWQSAHDVKRALEFVEPGSAPPTRSTRAYQWAGWIAAAILLLAVATLLSVRRGPGSAPYVVSFPVYPPEGTAFSQARNRTVNVPQFALSPDGRALAFVASPLDTPPVLWLRQLGEVASHKLPGTENAQQPFWSPDSLWLGFYADGKLKKIQAAGGAARVVSQLTADFTGGTWGPDNTILFGHGNEAIARVGAGGGSISPISNVDPPVGTQLRLPYFLPDGSHFLYFIASAEGSGVYAGSLDGKTRRLLVRINNSAVYAPPGYLLFAEGGTLLAQAFNANRLEVSGQPFLVAEHVGRSSGFDSAVSASRAGVVAYAGIISQRGRLTWFDRGGSVLGSAAQPDDYSDFRLSPDARSMAASLVDEKTGIIDIWIRDLGRSSASRFAFGRVLSASPVWSPDGAQIAFRTIRNGRVEFYKKSAGGGGREEPLLTVEAEGAAQIRGTNIVPTDWSPDGEHVLFHSSSPESGDDLWILPLSGDKKPYKFVATPAEEMHGNFSPDGSLVAYASNESGRFEVYVETFPKSDHRWPVSTNGGYEPRWRADGREIYYLSEDRKLMAVSVGPGPSFGVPAPLFQTRVPAGVSANRTHYVPSRDGKRFLVNTQSGDASPEPITVVLNWTAGLGK